MAPQKTPCFNKEEANQGRAQGGGANGHGEDRNGVCLTPGKLVVMKVNKEAKVTLTWTVYWKQRGPAAMEQKFVPFPPEEEMPKRGAVDLGAHRAMLEFHNRFYFDG